MPNTGNATPLTAAAAMELAAQRWCEEHPEATFELAVDLEIDRRGDGPQRVGSSTHMTMAEFADLAQQALRAALAR